MQGVRERPIRLTSEFTIIHLCKKSSAVSTAVVSSAYRSNEIINFVIEQILGGGFFNFSCTTLTGMYIFYEKSSKSDGNEDIGQVTQ